jgi:hypothetical protein
MILVEEWINESREMRTSHIDMSEDCIERGGNSTVHRGVLAQYLHTNITSNVDLCHNCGNDKCSNPKHLYWGTRKENVQDSRRHGTWKSAWDAMVEKYGYQEACNINRKNSNPSLAGRGNKGKSKSIEHRKKISESLKNNAKVTE